MTVHTVTILQAHRLSSHEIHKHAQARSCNSRCVQVHNILTNKSLHTSNITEGPLTLALANRFPFLNGYPLTACSLPLLTTLGDHGA